MNLKKLFDDIQGHPLVIAIGIFVLLFIVFNVFKKNGATKPGITGLAPGTYIDPVTGAVTAQPQTQEIYAQQYNSYPTGGTTIVGGVSGLPIPKPPITPLPPVPVIPPPPPKPTSTFSTVRAQFSQPSVKAWDTKYGGIPVRTAPGVLTTFKSLIPFGTKVGITGAPVSGGSNLPGGGGTNLWYPVTGGGYVSQYDLGTIFNG